MLGLALALLLALTATAALAETAHSPDLHAIGPAPDWVGTALPGGRIERPPICARREGVARHRAFNMAGQPLERRGDGEGAYWAGKDGMAVLDWHHKRRVYLSFAKRPFLVAAWCENPRPIRRNTIIAEEDGGWHWADGNGP